MIFVAADVEQQSAVCLLEGLQTARGQVYRQGSTEDLAMQVSSFRRQPLTSKSERLQELESLLHSIARSLRFETINCYEAPTSDMLLQHSYSSTQSSQELSRVSKHKFAMSKFARCKILWFVTPLLSNVSGCGTPVKVNCQLI